jgi:hypothetical protein
MADIKTRDVTRGSIKTLDRAASSIQLMFSMMLTDESRPIRMCKNCGKAFIARRHRDKFCSKECAEEWKKSDS